MKSILFIANNDSAINHLQAHLGMYGYEMTLKQDCENLFYCLKRNRYMGIIIDSDYAGMKQALECCKLLSKNFIELIFILATTISDEVHIKFLEAGANEYITKSINPAILLAKLNRLNRRKDFSSHLDTQLTFGKLKINLNTRKVILENTLIELKSSEFDLLTMLAIHAGKILTRQNIMHALKNRDYDGIDRSIDLRISYLRKKFADDLTRPYRIKTIRGEGYLLDPTAWE